MTDFGFEKFTLQELQAIVNAYYAGPSAFFDLENDKEMAGLAIYALDSAFCEAALEYLTNDR